MKSISFIQIFIYCAAFQADPGGQGGYYSNMCKKIMYDSVE